MRTGDTIVAQASAPGWSPRAIVRMSGPGTFSLLDAITTRADARARGGVPARLRLPWPDGESLQLPVLILRFPAPRSFTGEDSAEVHLVGNVWVVDALLDEACRHPDVRPAEPGEFSARAWLNGRLSIEQAEGVQAMIAARNDAELAAATRLLAGDTGAACRRLADDLGAALALVEAGIDFVEEEDVVAIAPDALALRLTAIRAALVQLGADAEATPREADPLVVLVGPPNAGKSTLFNRLLGRPRAVVSDIAGTTRDALVERVEVDSDAEWKAAAPGPVDTRALRLVDLAGLDDALARGGDMDRRAQQRARAHVAAADVVLLCDPDARFLEEAIVPPATPRLRIRTKADLPAPGHTRDALAVCALDGWRLGALRRAILDAIAAPGAADSLLVMPRHRRALAETRRAVECALEMAAAQRGSPVLAAPELMGAELRTGLDALASLAGEVTPDDVIGRIFASFCIGK